MGASYRIDDRTVLRGGYGKTFDPFPIVASDARTIPADDRAQRQRTEHLHAVWESANGITLAPSPNDILNTGTAVLPRGVDMTTPDLNNFDRGATQSYNVMIERRLPLDIVTSVGYVGTRTDGTYTTRNLNYARERRQREPEIVHAGWNGDD